MNASDGLQAARPTVAPGGRGGIYRPHYDPWFDDDMEDSVRQLSLELWEHPSTRPHLEKWGLCYKSRLEDGRLVLGCQRCAPESCSCGEDHGGTTWPRMREYMVECFEDSQLRPIFDRLKLRVRP